MEDGRTRPEGPVKVVVVARDAARQVQYEAALRVAGTPALATADPDAGADYVVQHRPTVLVLDQGLPRLALFRLYGLARQEEGPTPIQVVFVGQDDDTGPDDHYLPGDPSPSRVAVQVSTLITRLDEAGDEDEGTRPLTAGGSARTGAAGAMAAADAARAAQPQPAQPQVSPGTPPMPSGQTQPMPPAGVRSDRPADASDNGAAPVADAADPAAVVATTEAPKRPGRRLDVMLVRIGLVLLILGGLLFLLQIQQSSQGPLVTPTVAPSTPARKPAASPSPASYRSQPSGQPAALVAPASVAALTIA